MREKLEKFNRLLIYPLNLKSRLAICIAALLIIPSLFLPLWTMDFTAQQYPEGLELFIYSNAMVGGDDGNDLTEINVLNHYIGMRELHEDDFLEFKWIPLVIGLLFIVALRAAAIGTIKSVVDIIVGMIYFGAFSLWRFWYMLSSYGHQLDPKAAVKVEPFTPPLFGSNLVGQFTVESFPGTGSYCMFLFVLLLLLAVFLSFKESKQFNSAQD